MRLPVLVLLCVMGVSPVFAEAQAPDKKDVQQALRKAATFFHKHVARHGGYLWAYSGDLKLREAEGVAGESVAWVQPPGTPAVGSSFLDAYDATGEKLFLDAARDAAAALIKGQLRSGGWYYHIEFDLQKRAEFGYRVEPAQAKQKLQTTLDDDTTAAAVRFLMQLDKVQDFKDKKVHEAAEYALESILRAQFPNGGWYQWWKEFPKLASEMDYPIKKASYPPSWSRKWLNDWTGKYFLNDDVIVNVMLTLLQAHRTYGANKYLLAAKKAGDFLVLAQMPQPQPAWAQQYNIDMHPVWDRKFEPPAISGRESQTALQGLLMLFRYTCDKKYLEPVPPALAYLKKSLLPDGKLARFYELHTNKPLYFKRTGKVYDLTYSDADLPDHYAFQVESWLGAIEQEHQRVLKADPQTLAKGPIQLAPGMATISPQQAKQIIDALDARGAWVETGKLKHQKVAPASGVISCQTFVTNMQALSRYLPQ